MPSVVGLPPLSKGEQKGIPAGLSSRTPKDQAAGLGSQRTHCCHRHQKVNKTGTETVQTCPGSKSPVTTTRKRSEDCLSSLVNTKLMLCRGRTQWKSNEYSLNAESTTENILFSCHLLCVHEPNIDAKHVPAPMLDSHSHRCSQNVVPLRSRG